MKVSYIKLLKQKPKRMKVNKNNKVFNKKLFYAENIEIERVKSGFGKIFKKNQIALFSVALMLITAGYLNYNNMSVAELGDAKLVSSSTIEEDNIIETAIPEIENAIETTIPSDENAVETVVTPTESSINTEAENTEKIETKEVSNDVQYYANTRMERDNMYSQMLETYQKILENDKVPNEQKTVASNEIKNINDRKNAISIIENLIKNKGFEDAVVLLNDNNINVVIKQKEDLKDEQVAQITNIVSRELNADIEDIHDSNQ